MGFNLEMFFKELEALSMEGALYGLSPEMQLELIRRKIADNKAYAISCGMIPKSWEI